MPGRRQSATIFVAYWAMPVVIRELTVQSLQDTIDQLNARLKRLEQVLTVTGDPLLIGGITNLAIKTTGAIILEAAKDIQIKGQSVSVRAGASRVEVINNKVAVSCASEFNVTAPSTRFSTSNFSVYAPVARFSGTVRSDALITNSVAASSYTPSAGNVW